MNNPAKTFIPLFLGVYVVSAQELKKEERFLEPFNVIEVSGNEHVTLAQSDVNKLTITYSGGDPSDITATISNGKLTLNKRKGSELKGIKIRIEGQDFSNIILAGAADLKSDGVIKADNLNLSVSGAGDLKLNVEANTIKSVISGAGDVELSGKANTHITEISGAGDLKAINLETKVTRATVSGSGDAKVNATDELTATITGAGGVFYKTEPAVKNIDVSAAGTARKIDGSKPAKDSTKIRLGDTHVIIVPGEDGKKEFEFNWSDSLNTENKKTYSSGYHHWAGLDLGVNMLHYNGNSFQTPAGWPFLETNYGKSFNWRFNFAEKDFNLYQEKVNLVTGLGLEWANYGLLNRYTLTPNAPVIAASATTQDFKKNRLQSIWINVPALLEFNTSNSTKKSAHVAIGVIGGYRLGASYKQKFFIDDKKYKNKVKDDFNLNDYKLAATVRVGYGKFTVWGEYNITSMFKNNQGPLIYPVSLGITLIPFD